LTCITRVVCTVGALTNPGYTIGIRKASRIAHPYPDGKVWA